MSVLFRSCGQLLFGCLLTATATLVVMAARDAHRAGVERLRRSQ